MFTTVNSGSLDKLFEFDFNINLNSYHAEINTIFGICEWKNDMNKML